MDLFGAELLEADTHRAVFGDLPSGLVRDLRTAAVGDLVLQLLDAGWRRGQLASRIGKMPASDDPVGAVTSLLRALLEQLPPDARWREERQERTVQRSRAEDEQPATEESQQQWLTRIRAELAAPRRVRPTGPRRVRPACALCGEESAYFVTLQVRLCAGCVEHLGAGAMQRPEAG